MKWLQKFVSIRRPWIFENSKIPVWLSKVAPIEIWALSFACFVFCRGKLSKTTRRHETIHYHQQIQKLEKDFKDKLNLVAISSNDIVNYPQDGPEKMRLLWEELGLEFPYLYDETQDIAKKYKAECTPEFYLFNEDRKLVYRGRLDETSPGSGNLDSLCLEKTFSHQLLLQSPPLFPETSSESTPISLF